MSNFSSNFSQNTIFKLKKKKFSNFDLQAHTSPRVTPTKGANPYGDRFMPLRQSNHDWNSRYQSITGGEHDGFKKPMGSCNRHLNLGSTTSSVTSSSSSTSLSTSTSTSSSLSSTHHSSFTASQAHDYYQGTSSGSTTPTGTTTTNCVDDQSSGQAVVRALLRNEMLKDRIDDVKTSIVPSEGELSSFSMGPIVTAFSGTSAAVELTISSTAATAASSSASSTVSTAPATVPATPGTPGSGAVVVAQLERNAYGGSVDSVFPVVEGSSSSLNGINDTTRIHGALSPTIAEMMEPRLRGGSELIQEIPQSPSGSVCGDTPQKNPSLPLSPIPVKNSPARALFAYSAKTTPVKVFGQQAPTVNSPFGGPLGVDSQRLLRTPRKPTRKVPKNPYKVLDAPELQDDFYLNLVDWSSQNQLSVGLSSCVYLWSATTSQVGLIVPPRRRVSYFDFA